jgi:hypothetical protein
MVLAGLGGVGTVAAFFADSHQFAFSYLVAFMFFLSLGLGGLFLVILHHLFDANWSVPVRRITENLAMLLIPLAVLFIPIAILAPHLYPWMDPAKADHALHSKSGYLNPVFFYIRMVAYFAIWSFLAWRLRYWSLQQDQSGAAVCTHRMRRLAAAGIFLFAFTLTFSAIDWMKSLQHQWFSTMYGVYYFAGSVWTTLATLYFLATWLRQSGPLSQVLQLRQMKDIGTLLLAFTVFYAYIHFSQYLIIWNANMPEETFWYALREKGYWWKVCMMLVFGHFLFPFLLLLRIDFKLKLSLMIPLCLWAWAMHYLDMSFNILPVLHVENFPWHWTDVVCWLFIGGSLAVIFLKNLASNSIYPLKDPRLKEALTIHEVPPPAIAGGAHNE